MASTAKKIKIFIATNEASGDDLAIYLIEQIQSYLKRKDPKLLANLSFYAVAGSKLKKANIPILFDSSHLSVIGLFEILFYLPKLIQLRNQIYQFCLSWRADLFIGVDSPDFFLPLEKKLKQQGIKTIHFVCPSVYAWRAYRLKKIAASVDLLLGIMPFENKFIQAYCQNHQIKLNYQSLTHPIYQAKEADHSLGSIKEDLKLSKESKIIALFLGSRTGEIKKHLPVLIPFLKAIKKNYPNYVFISSTFNQSHHQLIQDSFNQNQLNHCFSLIDRLDDLIDQCDFAISKSGTINLYLAKKAKPMIIFYQLNPLSYWIIRALAYQNYVSLVNWSLGKKVFPELIQSQFNAKNLTIEFKKMIDQPNRFNQAFKQINASFSENASTNQVHQPSQTNFALEKIHQLIVSKD